MRIKTWFVVPEGMAAVWTVVSDPLTVELLPGASIDRRNGEFIEGRFQITIGTLAMSYSGRLQLVKRDEEGRRLVLAARGEDHNGGGRVSADVVLHLEKQSPSQTRCTVHIDLDVTGAPATMGGPAVESAIWRLTDNCAQAVRRRVGLLPASRQPTSAARRFETTTRRRGWLFKAATPVRSIVAVMVGGFIAGTLVKVVARRMSRRRR